MLLHRVAQIPEDHTMRSRLLLAALAAALLMGGAAAAPGVRGGPPKAKPRPKDIPYIRCQARFDECC